jgi:aspartate aminotransferase
MSTCRRRNFLIDGLNRIPGVFSPIPMGAFYTVARLAGRRCRPFLQMATCLTFEYEKQTVFMAPASGFYTTPGMGMNEVRIAYVLRKEDLAISLKILEEALKVYPDKTLN